MSKEIKVYCVVAVYNVESYISLCIDSLLNQTYDNYEVVLVDDGSTDSSGLICDKYAEKSQVVRVLHKSNGGLSSARNYAIDEINDGYVTFIDGDDVVAPDYIEALVSILPQSARPLSVVQLHSIGDPQSWLDGLCSTSQDVDVLDSREALHRLLLRKDITESACGKLAPFACWKQSRFPDGRVYEDLSVVPQLIGDSDRIGVSTAKLYGQVCRVGSITRSKVITNKQYHDCAMAIQQSTSYISSRYAQCLQAELRLFSILQCIRIVRLFSEIQDPNEESYGVLCESKRYLRSKESSIIRSSEAGWSLRLKLILILHFPSVYQSLFSINERRKAIN